MLSLARVKWAQVHFKTMEKMAQYLQYNYGVILHGDFW